MKIAIFITCLTDNFYPRTGEAMVRVLEHAGHEVAFPAAQTCCGQPMYNNGLLDEARPLALRLARVFEPFEYVVTASGSCAAMVREHATHLFPHDSREHEAVKSLAAKTFEFAEFLFDVLKIDLSGCVSGIAQTVTSHYSCHLRTLGMTSEHEALLMGIPGVEYRSLDYGEQCCGFGGTFAIKYPTISGQMVADKVSAIASSGAQTVVCSDAGCTLNIAGACHRAGVNVAFKSLPEMIAEALGLMPRMQVEQRKKEPIAQAIGASSASNIAEAPHTHDCGSSHASPLFPPLPYDMKPGAAKAAKDVQLQQFVNSATRSKDRGRATVCRTDFGERYDALRKLAGSIKQHTLDHLDVYLERFIEQAEKAGTTVHAARDAGEANAICLDIAKRHNSKLCVKSKSMVTEETHLLPALLDAGIETVETDLGEFIIQLDGDAPSHIVTPMIHKNRASVGRAFERELGVRYTEDPSELTMIAREHLRRKYRDADLGISGANFLVAETGTIVICTNEGNADFCVAGPRVHIAFVGIEKLIPRLSDLSVLLKLLARSATAQPLTVYTTLINGPRKADEPDGPDELHIILLDNGRTELLRDESRELLRCIRCGACLNACPVYRKVGGGHAYGSVYSGPIGAVLTPLLKGLENYRDLPQASSLCGACFEACPVHIDIPRHLVRLREQLAKKKLVAWQDRTLMKLWSRSLGLPGGYSLGAGALRVLLRGMGSAHSGDERWVTRAPGPLGAWTSVRDLQAPAPTSFRQWWGRRGLDGRE